MKLFISLGAAEKLFLLCTLNNWTKMKKTMKYLYSIGILNNKRNIYYLFDV